MGFELYRRRGIVRNILFGILSVLVLFTFSYSGTAKVLWLTVQKSGDVIEVLEQKTVEGAFKKNRRRAAQLKTGGVKRPTNTTHYYQVLNARGDILYEAPFVDPTIVHVDSRQENGSHNGKVVQSHERATFTLKIPVEGDPGSVHFYRVEQGSHRLPLKQQAQGVQDNRVITDIHLGSFLLGGN